MRFEEITNENLKQWFKEKWVRFGPDGKIRGDCARGSDSEGKPKCLPQSKANALGKKGRASAAQKKRREDPDPERRGPAHNVATRVREEELDEKWSQKYKSSINCAHPKGFSQKAHCAGKKKHNESIEMEMTCPDCGRCETHGDSTRNTIDEACWKGYHKEGMKTMFGKRYPNCVKNEAVEEGEGSYPEVLYHGSTQEIKGPLTPRQAHDIGGAPGSNKNAIYATDDPNFAIAYSLAERGSDTGTLGWKQDPHLIFFGGKIRHGQNVYLYTLPTRDQQGNPLFTPGSADAEWHSVPGVTAVTPIKVKALPVDRYLGLLRKPTPDEQKVFQANQARDKAKRGIAEGSEQKPVVINTNPDWFGATIDKPIISRLPVTMVPFDQLEMWEKAKNLNDPKIAKWVNQTLLPELKKTGKLKPLTIMVGKGKYLVIDGNHRYLAYQAAGFKNQPVPVQLVPKDMIEYSTEKPQDINELAKNQKQDVAEGHESCPECGGAMYPDTMIAEKQDACYYKVKSRYKVWPSAYASGALVQCRKKGAANWGNKSKNESQENTVDELSRIVELSTGLSLEARAELAEEFDLIESIIEGLAEHNAVDSEAIWEDLETLTDDELYVFATTVPVMEDWQKVNKRDRTAGMSPKAVKAYRREHPGSKLQTAVTTKPSKLKKGSKASKRRKSYCSRSRGQMKMHNISCAKTPDKAICKARRRWNCE